MSPARTTRRQKNPRTKKATGRLAGTRARGPGDASGVPQTLGRHLAAVGVLLAVLAGIAVAPHAWERARFALQHEPFLLTNVQVRGLERLTPESVRTTLALEAGVPIAEIDVAAAEQRLRAHPWIADATVVRFPPDGLRVHVEEQTALAVVAVADDARLHAVNADGVPFAPASDADASRLLHVALSEAPAVNVPNPELSEALKLGASLHERGLAVPRHVRVGLPDREQSAELRLRGFAPAIWIERDRHADQLDRLATLLASNLTTATEARLIDLRFADRAVLWRGE